MPLGSHSAAPPAAGYVRVCSEFRLTWDPSHMQSETYALSVEQNHQQPQTLAALCDGSLVLPMLGLPGLTWSAKPELQSHRSPCPLDLTSSTPAGPDHVGTLQTA